MKYLIVGLGNIGSEYRDTRHNIGFMAAHRLCEKLNVTPELDRHAYYALGKYKGRQLHIILPTTYMNLSGKAVRFHMKKHDIPIDNIMVITDDIALPFGRMRLRGKGSAGGHNGLKNIEEVLGTNEYPRLRFGVGDNFSRGRQVDYVLSDFTDDEFIDIPDLLDQCVEGILSFVTIGLGKTMTELNKKKKD
ncbi:MAG: aminoacyl-tRNA hydrolase [Bacteroidetes bacterium]|nr:aminoacyl-tRNA hydrolase [Bacteroidota bacterium]MCB0842566.1 aminoacyl-tRNA hydrolase [Bacteroidota bacterium]MCB0851199.1 aminoacyl-tRNA hydrolase [Bacteroidota bacterium]